MLQPDLLTVAGGFRQPGGVTAVPIKRRSQHEPDLLVGVEVLLVEDLELVLVVGQALARHVHIVKVRVAALLAQGAQLLVGVGAARRGGIPAMTCRELWRSAHMKARKVKQSHPSLEGSAGSLLCGIGHIPVQHSQLFELLQRHGLWRVQLVRQAGVLRRGIHVIRVHHFLCACGKFPKCGDNLKSEERGAVCVARMLWSKQFKGSEKSRIPAVGLITNHDYCNCTCKTFWRPPD